MSRGLAGLGAALLVAAAAAAGGFQKASPPPRRPLDPSLLPPGEGLVAAEDEIRLDATNAWVVPRALSDVDVRFHLDAGPLAVLEVRLRAPDPTRAEGVAFLVGTEPRVDTGFVRETEGRFVRLGPRSDALRGRFDPPPVRVTARGDRLEAYVNDASTPLVTARDRRFDRGAVVLLAARGEVTLRDLTVEAIAGPEAGAGRTPWRRFAFLLAPFLWMAGLSRLSRRVGAGVRRGPARAALAGAPFAAALALPVPDGASGEAWRAVLVALGVGLTFAAAWRGASDAGRLAVAALALVAAFSTASTVWRGEPASEPDADTYEGRRLERGFLDLEHPAVRAGLPWLADHSFGGVRVDGPPDRPRVLVVGRSHGALAAALERALGEDARVLDGSAPAGGWLAAKTLLDRVGEVVTPAVVVLAGANPDVDRLDPDAFAPFERRTFADRLLEGRAEDAVVSGRVEALGVDVEAAARALGADVVRVDPAAPDEVAAAAAAAAVAERLRVRQDGDEEGERGSER